MFSEVLANVSQLVSYSSSYSSSSSDASGAALGVMSLIYCCMLLVILAVVIGLTYWVYNDAKKSNVENPTLWAVLTFFLGIWGIIIYLLVGKKK